MRWDRLRRSTKARAAPTAPPADASAQRRETDEQVRRAVAKLPAKEREVVVLYYLEELSAAEVGQVLKISPGAVDVRLHRARAHLRQRLSDLSAM